MKPVLQALVLAERVYEDKSGKKIIAGTFHGLTISRAPPVQTETAPDGTVRHMVRGGAELGSPFAYISLTDVCDGTVLGLQFVNLTKNEVRFQSNITVQCTDRLQTIEIVVALPQMQIAVHSAGVYAFEIVCEGEVIGSHRVVAKEATA